MAKPANKIWCPKCHKRHRIPANAGGMTLRCRGCKFAFRVQDGLTSDPGTTVSPIPPQEPASDSIKAESRANAIPVPTAPNTNQADLKETAAAPLDLDHDYDDILEVLETPDEDPLAPPRALAKRSASNAGVPSDQPTSVPESAENAVPRQPVTRQQLRTHRNSRQFWMLISCVVACLLGAASWFSVSLLMSPTLSQWERKMLFAMGAPARWLPPQTAEEEEILPPKHVGLRGDHLELADRNDFFRDEFLNDNPLDADRNVNDATTDERGNRRNGAGIADNARRPVGGGIRMIAPAEADPRDPRNMANAGGRRAGRNAPPRNDRNRGGNQNAGPARDAWAPPELSLTDIQLVATRGIDPKMLKMFAVETDHRMNVALAENIVFSIGRKNSLSAFDINSNRVIANRKLGNEVAAICAAKRNEITKRPAAWILFESGKLEKWEVGLAELNRVVAVSLRPVFKQNQVNVAAGKRTIAYHLDQQIIIANILETASKVDFESNIPTEGKVLGLRFSADDSQLLAVVEQKVILFEVASGKVISERNLPPSFFDDNGADARSIEISSDLSTLFICNSTSIDSFDAINGSVNGKYWNSIPLPFGGVAVNENQLLGLTTGPKSQATTFSITSMTRPEAPNRNENEQVQARVENRNPDEQPNLLGKKVADPVAGQIPFLVDRSPEFSAPIQMVKSLPDNRIAFLTTEANGNRVAIATWKGGWNVVPLQFEPNIKIQKFAFSEDLTRVAIVKNDVVQGWEVLDLKKGTVKFVCEFAGHRQTVTQLKFTGDSQRVVSGDLSGNVYAWNFSDGSQTGRVDGFDTMIKSISMRGDSGFVAMDQKGVANGSAASNRSKIKPFNRMLSGAATLSDNGGRIAFFLGSDLNVADVSSQKVIDSFQPGNRVESIQFSRDQKFLLLQTREEIAVWNWRQGIRERVFRFKAGTFITGSGAFDRSIDGKTIAVVGGKKRNQISIFELPTTETKKQ